MSITRRVVTNGTTFRIQFHVGDEKWACHTTEYATAEEAQARVDAWNAQDGQDAGPWMPVGGGEPARSDSNS